MNMQVAFVGQINLFARNNPVPPGWIACEGQWPMVKDHENLYKAIGSVFGKQDSPFGEAFRLPEMSAADGVKYYINETLPFENPEGAIGEIVLFCENVVPEGWVKCDGQLLSIDDNMLLHKFLGGKFGHNDTSFALPNIPPPAEHLVYAICASGKVPWGDNVDAFQMDGTMGEIQLFPTEKNFDHNQWYICNGQSVPIRESQLLYSIIGQSFGGSGDHFSMPSIGSPAAGVNYVICANGLMPES